MRCKTLSIHRKLRVDWSSGSHGYHVLYLVADEVGFFLSTFLRFLFTPRRTRVAFGCTIPIKVSFCVVKELRTIFFSTAVKISASHVLTCDLIILVDFCSYTLQKAVCWLIFYFPFINCGVFPHQNVLLKNEFLFVNPRLCVYVFIICVKTFS